MTPDLVVATPDAVNVRDTGDGQWFADCAHCGAWSMGFSRGEAVRINAAHVTEVHGDA